MNKEITLLIFVLLFVFSTKYAFSNVYKLTITNKLNKEIKNYSLMINLTKYNISTPIIVCSNYSTCSNTVVPYCYQQPTGECNQTPSNIVWIKVNLSVGNTTLYIINNGSNYATSGDKVFLFYSDFNNGSNGWNCYNGGGNGKCYSENGFYVLYAPDTSNRVHANHEVIKLPPSGECVILDLKTFGKNIGDGFLFGFEDGSGEISSSRDEPVNGYFVGYGRYGNSRITISRSSSGSVTDLATSSFSVTDNVNYTPAFIWCSNGSLYAMENESTGKITLSTRDTSFSSFNYVFVTSDYGYWYYDWVRVRVWLPKSEQPTINVSIYYTVNVTINVGNVFYSLSKIPVRILVTNVSSKSTITCSIYDNLSKSYVSKANKTVTPVNNTVNVTLYLTAPPRPDYYYLCCTAYNTYRCKKIAVVENITITSQLLDLLNQTYQKLQEINSSLMRIENVTHNLSNITSELYDVVSKFNGNASTLIQELNSTINDLNAVKDELNQTYSNITRYLVNLNSSIYSYYNNIINNITRLSNETSLLIYYLQKNLSDKIDNARIQVIDQIYNVKQAINSMNNTLYSIINKLDVMNKELMKLYNLTLMINQTINNNIYNASAEVQLTVINQTNLVLSKLQQLNIELSGKLSVQIGKIVKRLGNLSKVNVELSCPYTSIVSQPIRCQVFVKLMGDYLEVPVDVIISRYNYSIGRYVIVESYTTYTYSGYTDVVFVPHKEGMYEVTIHIPAGYYTTQGGNYYILNTFTSRVIYVTRPRSIHLEGSIVPLAMINPVVILVLSLLLIVITFLRDYIFNRML